MRSPPQVHRLALAIVAFCACTPEQVGCEPRASLPGNDEPARDSPPAHDDGPVDVRGSGSIEYTLSFPAPQTHYMEVTGVFPTLDGSLELMLPVWIPGSYMVREFARHFEDVRAATTEGDPLTIDKTTKNTWRVSGEEMPDQVVVRYRVYARELSARTNFVDADFALIQGACTFLTPIDQEGAPIASELDIRLELPDEWSSSYAGLKSHEEDRHRFVATDYDELADAPIVAGNPTVHEVSVGDAMHRLVDIGGHGVWDGERAVADVEKIIATQHRFWGHVPYETYTFFNLLVGSGGGIEHRSSTVILGSRWSTHDDDSYRSWLGLVSHELFHTWNVKRLRPRALGPFAYGTENYVRDLWLVEGVTSYYDDLLVRRSGLQTRDEYLAALSKTIERVQTTPGRHVQSLSDSSFDAWIKFYRHDENSHNSQVSYYSKGALVAWLLDARIRAASGDEQSLDTVMRAAYERFPITEAGYTSEQFRQLVNEVTGIDVSAFMTEAVDTVDELDYGPALRHFGLRFKEPAPIEDGDSVPALLGVDVRSQDGRHIVRRVVRGTPAWECGINVDDELLAINDFRIDDDLSEVVSRYSPGETLSVLLSRRGRIRRLEATLVEAPRDTWSLELDPDASPGQRRIYEAWIGSE